MAEGAPTSPIAKKRTGSYVVTDKESMARDLSVKSGLLNVGAEFSISKTDGLKGFALVGLGRAGSFHRSALRQLADLAKLLWVVDVDEERVKAVADLECCRGSTEVGDALADPEVDALIVASTTNTHYEYCMAGLRAGKAVFTEKPISHDPVQLQEVLDTAISQGVPFVVGYQRRVDKNFRELQRQVTKEKVLGGLRIIRCTSRDNPLPPLEYLRVSGGIFHDMLCHDFDMIHFLAEDWPEEIHSYGHCHNEDIRAMDDIDMVTVQMKFSSGLLATVDCSRVAEYGYDQRLEVLGDKGMATAHNEQSNTVVVATANGFTHPKTQYSFPQRYEHTYAQEVAEFVALVREGGTEPEEVVRRHVMTDRVTTAAELSWRLGRAVKIADVDSLRKHLPH